MAQRGTCKIQKHEQESNSSIVWPFQHYLTSKIMLFLYTFSHQPATSNLMFFLYKHPVPINVAKLTPLVKPLEAARLCCCTAMSLHCTAPAAGLRLYPPLGAALLTPPSLLLIMLRHTSPAWRPLLENTITP